MKRLLLMIIFFSISIAGTTYLTLSSDDDNNSEIMSFGYNHNIVKLNKFSLAIGGDYSSNLKGESYFNSYDNLDLASVYLLPSFSISEKISLWTSLGYSLVANDSGIETQCGQNFPGSESGWEGTTEDCELNSGVTYGFGAHVMLGNKIGVGARFTSQPLKLTSYEGAYTYKDMDRVNLYFSYQF